MTNLDVDKTICVPTCCLPKAGRPKKKRYIGAREKAVSEMRAKHVKKQMAGTAKSKILIERKVIVEAKIVPEDVPSSEM